MYEMYSKQGAKAIAALVNDLVVRHQAGKGVKRYYKAQLALIIKAHSEAGDTAVREHIVNELYSRLGEQPGLMFEQLIFGSNQANRTCLQPGYDLGAAFAKVQVKKG